MENKNKPNLPQVDNQALEEAMKAFKEENSRENLQKLSNFLIGAKVYVPAKPDKPIPPHIMEKMKTGQKLKPEEAPKFHPMIVKNAQEDTFIPAFTSPESMPKEHKYEGMLTIPFVDVAAMAIKPETKVKGIVLNPVTHNLTVHPPLMEAMVKQAQQMKNAGSNGAAPNTKTVRMTPEQFRAFARRTTEHGALPKILSEKKGKFMKDLEEKREELLLALYRVPYGDKIPCPYQVSDFDLMLLDISDTRQVAICSLPQKNLQPGNCLTLYMFWNPETDVTWYYMIEKPAEGDENLLCCVTAEGKHEVIGAAPAPGTELSTIMDMLED